MMKKPLLVFVVGSIILALIFFTLPINIFNGVIEYDNGVQQFAIETRLSLSYFVGIGYDIEDMTNVHNFYLTAQGIVFAFLVIIGFPALVGYRVYLRNK